MFGLLRSHEEKPDLRQGGGRLDVFMPTKVEPPSSHAAAFYSPIPPAHSLVTVPCRSVPSRQTGVSFTCTFEP